MHCLTYLFLYYDNPRRYIHIYLYIYVYVYIYSCCSVPKSCLSLCGPMDCSIARLPVLQHLPEFAQTHIHWVSDTILPSHPLSSPSLPAFNLYQHQGLFQWVGSSHQVAKILELQHQSFHEYSGFISFRIDSPYHVSKKEMSTYSSILAWRIPWMEEPGGL